MNDGLSKLSAAGSVHHCTTHNSKYIHTAAATLPALIEQKHKFVVALVLKCTCGNEIAHVREYFSSSVLCKI